MGQSKSKQTHRKNQNNIEECDICIFKYDKKDHLPILICSWKHTICSSCLKDLKDPVLCPFCREHIDKSTIRLNFFILNKLRERACDNHDGKTNFHEGEPNINVKLPSRGFGVTGLLLICILLLFLLP